MDEIEKNAEPKTHVPMVVCPRPFTMEGRQVRSFAPGESIAQLMRQCGLDPSRIPARVFLDDQLIESAYWHVVKPKAGHLVSVRIIPEGGGGQGKDVLRVVAMIGVLALALSAPYLAPAAWGLTTATYSGVAFSTLGSFVAAGISIVGMLAVNGPIPLPLPRRSVPLPTEDPARRIAA